MIFKAVKSVLACHLLFFCIISLAPLVTQAEALGNLGTLNTAAENSTNRIGAGEYLPISIKLINFGSQRRVDVVIDYQILDDRGIQVYLETETVAVDTTASFIKRILLPPSMKSGMYTAVTTLHYPEQESPAISQFPFVVERKFAGFFWTDLIFYSICLVIIMAAAISITYLITSLGKHKHAKLYDYSDKPKFERIYYEILSDIISQMRLRIGDDAIAIAQGIPDLEINEKTGFITNIKQDPAKIIALLIFRYEKLLGKKISFDLRK